VVKAALRAEKAEAALAALKAEIIRAFPDHGPIVINRAAGHESGMADRAATGPQGHVAHGLPAPAAPANKAAKPAARPNVITSPPTGSSPTPRPFDQRTEEEKIEDAIAQRIYQRRGRHAETEE